MDKLITKVCPICKAETKVVIPAAAYEAWQYGVCIQNAWPLGPAESRETLMTGFCSDCQKEVFDDE